MNWFPYITKSGGGANSTESLAMFDWITTDANEDIVDENDNFIILFQDDN